MSQGVGVCMYGWMYVCMYVCSNRGQLPLAGGEWSGVEWSRVESSHASSASLGTKPGPGQGETVDDNNALALQAALKMERQSNATEWNGMK